MNNQKVLVVIPAQGGSRALGENFHYALSQIGIESHLFDVRHYKEVFKREFEEGSPMVLEMVNRALLRDALAARADTVVVMALSPIGVHTVQALRNASIHTVHYYCEDLRASEHWRPVIGAYDDFFIIQKAPWLSKCRETNPRTHYLPNGAPVELMPERPTEKKYDVTFVGVPYPNRVSIFERLLSRGVSVSLFGWGWSKVSLSPALRSRVIDGERWINYPELFEILARSRMTINLHSTLSRKKDIDIDGDFVNPRTFTIPLAHTLQLTDRRKALPEFFTEDRDIVCFESMDELIEKIQHYTEHETEATPIIARARETVIDRHLLTHRAEALISTVQRSR